MAQAEIFDVVPKLTGILLSSSAGLLIVLIAFVV
jgi:hypothetical protein